MDERPFVAAPVLSPAAAEDVRAILSWSADQFGDEAAERYRELIVQAIYDVAADPERAGSRERRDLMVPGARTYHLSLSRHRVRNSEVSRPRHFLLYRLVADGSVEIGRILHDSRDLARHLPENYRA